MEVRVFRKESITATGKDMDMDMTLRSKTETTGVMEKYFFCLRIMQNVLFLVIRWAVDGRKWTLVVMDGEIRMLLCFSYILLLLPSVLVRMIKT